MKFNELPNEIKECLKTISYTEKTTQKISETEKYIYVGDEFDTYTREDLTQLLEYQKFLGITSGNRMRFAK